MSPYKRIICVCVCMFEREVCVCVCVCVCDFVRHTHTHIHTQTKKKVTPLNLRTHFFGRLIHTCTLTGWETYTQTHVSRSWCHIEDPLLSGTTSRERGCCCKDTHTYIHTHMLFQQTHTFNAANTQTHTWYKAERGKPWTSWGLQRERLKGSNHRSKQLRKVLFKLIKSFLKSPNQRPRLQVCVQMPLNFKNNLWFCFRVSPHWWCRNAATQYRTINLTHFFSSCKLQWRRSIKHDVKEPEDLSPLKALAAGDVRLTNIVGKVEKGSKVEKNFFLKP